MEEQNLETLAKKVQRALDFQEIQNVMAMHEYYHSANMGKEEIDNIWAQKTPGVAMEDYPTGRFEGIDLIMKYSYNMHLERGQRQLQEMRKLYPWIEDDPRNNFIGKTVMHTLTTQCLEVAEDGQTAKGVWISPGYLTLLSHGKLRAFWHWDRYGVDFVKEDGKWKIWHLHIYRDFLTPYEKSWVDSALDPDADLAIGQATPVNMPKPNAPSTSDALPYSPFTVSRFEPRPPEPYRTFDETFSY